MSWRHAVSVGVDGDAEVGAHLAGQRAEMLGSKGGQGLEKGPFAQQAVDGAFAGAAVDTDVGDGSAPVSGPCVQVV